MMTLPTTPSRLSFSLKLNADLESKCYTMYRSAVTTPLLRLTSSVQQPGPHPERYQDGPKTFTSVK